MTRLWPDPESPYKDRVDVLDSDRNSPNRSVLLKNVQWEDSTGKYECKLSYRAAKQDKRTKGSGVKLLIHGNKTISMLLPCCPLIAVFHFLYQTML